MYTASLKKRDKHTGVGRLPSDGESQPASQVCSPSGLEASARHAGPSFNI